MKTSSVFYRSLKQKYPMIDKAEGIYIYDTEGNKYLDGASGCLVTNIGYGVTEVAEAMKNEAERTGFVHGSMFTSRPQEQLAYEVAALAPEGLDYVYFVSGGTEANETAISMALQYHMQKGNKRKWKLIGRQYSYHGSSIGTLSVGGNTQRRNIYSPLVLPFPIIPAPHCYRCQYKLSYPGCGLRCAHDLEQTILREGPENVAAFMVEPIIGTSAAASVPPPDYFPVVREICNRYDVLLIADEVLCGYGRSGKYLAVEHWNVVPDIVTLGKGLGGGYTPLGAVLAHERVFEVFKNNWSKFIHGYTYQGNPISCAAGLAVYEYIRKNNLFDNAIKMGDFLKTLLTEICKKYDIVGDVRGEGLLFGLELIKNPDTKESFDKTFQVAETARVTAMEEGLILYTGVGGTADIIPRDYLIIAPPFTINKLQIENLIYLLGKTLSKVEDKLSFI